MEEARSSIAAPGNCARRSPTTPPRPDFEVQLEWEPYSYKGASWNRLLIDSLSHAIDWSLENAKGLCGSSAPVVNLVGFSSGGSAVGAVAHRYPQVQRMLLLSTYDSVGDQFYDGVYRFHRRHLPGLRRGGRHSRPFGSSIGRGPPGRPLLSSERGASLRTPFWTALPTTEMLSGAFLWAFGDPAGISSN